MQRVAASRGKPVLQLVRAPLRGDGVAGSLGHAASTWASSARSSVIRSETQESGLPKDRATSLLDHPSEIGKAIVKVIAKARSDKLCQGISSNDAVFALVVFAVDGVWVESEASALGIPAPQVPPVVDRAEGESAREVAGEVAVAWAGVCGTGENVAAGADEIRVEVPLEPDHLAEQMPERVLELGLRKRRAKVPTSRGDKDARAGEGFDVSAVAERPHPG